MQFREVSSRVQCYAAYYDPAAKRTRQKLVYVVDKFGKIETKPSPDELTPADFGTPEQRHKWAGEIAAYIDQHNAEDEKKRADVLPFMLKSAVDNIYAELRKKDSHLDNPFHLARMREQVKRLGKKLGLIVTTPERPKKEKSDAK
ncbi:hypothetical protein ELI24_39220 [Rhizobium ruizarguesonis]|uniref:hypothetical protein n=1 Tax=Rhizobium TaxID=379 RepID=UPI0010306015|nr:MULTISPECIES: hypothetical protein [Rhizobium]MBY2975519.1 hypothetical protein [Rhizobium leguminosarum]TAV82655.1 hypothetical protein ELI24_39220 [Rhizobium ruizarguesonis]TAZ43541.1 hypothetical protein ELH76_37690 [Rhizobium ruizarguesonis]